jgi:spermidine synthase
LGVPVASGVVFAAALDQPGQPQRVAGAVLATNTLGSVLGATATGLWVLPVLGLRTAVLATGTIALAGSVGVALHAERRKATRLAAVGCLLALCSPRWDPALYAVGVGLRVHEFADLSPRAVERFAHEGWTLRSYTDGRSASVAVGQSTTSGNLWLSLNGKVDASTGADMPTQVLSGALPVEILRHRDASGPVHAGVVGLASGITARATLDAGATAVTVVELEPAVVEAAALFSAHNGDLLEDPRVTVVVDDARAVLRRPGAPFDVLVSEPSNPWITGVSNLFTLEYWQLGRARLRQGGLFVQWLQLYALPPDALRGLVRTFLTVFDDVWLFETIPGADAVLLGTTPGARILPEEVKRLSLQPVLDPAGCRRLAGRARLNTDDQPWVEFAAPHWVHRQTNQDNAARIQDAARP